MRNKYQVKKIESSVISIDSVPQSVICIPLRMSYSLISHLSIFSIKPAEHDENNQDDVSKLLYPEADVLSYFHTRLKHLSKKN